MKAQVMNDSTFLKCVEVIRETQMQETDCTSKK